MTVTETEVVDLEKFAGKRVIVQVKLDEPNEQGHTLEEIEGKVEAASSVGIMLKPKGRTNIEIIESDNIESIDYAPEAPKKIVQKVLLPIDYGKARQHLVDRHGSTLDDAGEISEEKALEYHNSIDHTDLGHLHKTKEQQEADAEAAKQSGQESEQSGEGDDEAGE